MPKVKRKRFAKEFKQEAVRLLETDPRSGDEIAQDLGIERGMLYRWRRELGVTPAVVASVNQALSPDEREELRRLRREVEKLRMEREILKKATAFFVKESK